MTPARMVHLLHPLSFAPSLPEAELVWMLRGDHGLMGEGSLDMIRPPSSMSSNAPLTLQMPTTRPNAPWTTSVKVEPTSPLPISIPTLPIYLCSQRSWAAFVRNGKKNVDRYVLCVFVCVRACASEWEGVICLHDGSAVNMAEVVLKSRPFSPTMSTLNTILLN